MFLRLHDLVLDRQDEVLDLVQLETGKARRHALEEVRRRRAHRPPLRRAPARRYLRAGRHTGLVPVLSTAHELRHPKGVVGIVSPWNYPLTLAVSDAIPAFIAGNAVVHKPDTQTALTALWVRALAVEAGLPADAVAGRGRRRAGGRPGGRRRRRLRLLHRLDAASAARWPSAARRRLVGCSLELGGKNPMLVLADADLDRAAEGAVRDCFSNAGQLCISMERIYVVDGRRTTRSSTASSRRVQAMRLGAALDYGPTWAR